MLSKKESKIVDNPIILPYLKWAGGKRWFVKNHSDLLPTKFNTYYEPFLGSGAVYFALQPQKAVLADTNSRLIEIYTTIKKDWKKVRTALLVHSRNHSKKYYYSQRESIKRSIYERAAQFIYLNRTCWNGLYRVNLKGKFNVPIGTKDSVILDTDNFEATSMCLKNAKLFVSDFEPIIDQAKKGDFVFVDPPYTVMHNQNNFIKYNEKLFSWDDQIRLQESVLRAMKRGVSILLTNAYNPSIIKLYEKNFSIYPVKRQSVIAGNSKHRGLFEELIIKSKW